MGQKRIANQAVPSMKKDQTCDNWVGDIWIFVPVYGVLYGNIDIVGIGPTFHQVDQEVAIAMTCMHVY